uniref:EF-hand domain-containing protein n=1 Tax=Salix viminalis TaxID=40686 RepID=A0A6N2M275_SALVM
MGFKALFSRKKKKSRKPDASVDSPPAIVASMNDSKSPSIRLRPQAEELEHVFKKFDVNGDGKISSAELGSIMANLGHQATEDELQTMITEFDADGDGFIDLQEFVALNTQGVDTNEIMENLKDAFSVYDVDGNGSISAEELHKVMASLGEPCSMAECRKIISGVDSDGDGMIDFEEFKKACGDGHGACWGYNPDKFRTAGGSETQGSSTSCSSRDDDIEAEALHLLLFL